MTLEPVAQAMRRVRAALLRKPAMGLHDDSAATARWHGGTRFTAMHISGKLLTTDMPREFGGTADQMTPGWLMRAGIASCYATTIAMHAAERGIELEKLEVRVDSRSDTRGLLGIADGDGTAVRSGPRDLRVQVQIAARGVSEDQVRALVLECEAYAPVPQAVCNAIPIELVVTLGTA